jgi:hypothetical protein
MRIRLLLGTAAALLLATVGAPAAIARPCDGKCLEARIATLEGRVTALEASPPGVELTSEEQGYVLPEEEEKTIASESEEVSVWTFTCPEGFAALPGTYTVNPTIGAQTGFFGSELFSEGASFETLIGGGSTGHPVILKSRGICVRGRYIDFGG